MEFKGTKREGANWMININNPAQVLIENVCIIDEPWHLEAVKADALLISKAPEMLELIQAFLEANPSDGSWNYQACMDKARQITKEITDL